MTTAKTVANFTFRVWLLSILFFNTRVSRSEGVAARWGLLFLARLYWRCVRLVWAWLLRRHARRSDLFSNSILFLRFFLGQVNTRLWIRLSLLLNFYDTSLRASSTTQFALTLLRAVIILRRLVVIFLIITLRILISRLLVRTVFIRLIGVLLRIELVQFLFFLELLWYRTCALLRCLRWCRRLFFCLDQWSEKSAWIIYIFFSSFVQYSKVTFNHII